jgi:hypothetical protein
MTDKHQVSLQKVRVALTVIAFAIVAAAYGWHLLGR